MITDLPWAASTGPLVTETWWIYHCTSVITDAVCFSGIVPTTSAHAHYRPTVCAVYTHKMYVRVEYVTQMYPIFWVLIWGQPLCVYYVAVCSGNQSIYDYLTCLHIRNVKQLKEKQITNYLHVSVLNNY